MFSVVIITKNEEKRIGACLDSLFKDVNNKLIGQIIVVDSCSDDNTVQIALDYGVEVYCITNELDTCASAGRYIGYLQARHEYIFFIDGDMILEDGWLDFAREFLNENQYIAGVCGIMKEVYIVNGKKIGQEENYYKTVGIEEAVRLGGAVVFRKSSLQQIGTFDPNIVSDEEAELYSRFKKHNLNILRVPRGMCTHFTIPRSSIHQLKRIANKRLLGPGQVLRASLNNGLFLYHLKRNLKQIFILFWLILLLAISTSYILTGNPLFITIFLIMLMINSTFYILKQRKIIKGLSTMFKTYLYAVAIPVGFISYHKKEVEYVNKNRASLGT